MRNNKLSTLVNRFLIKAILRLLACIIIVAAFSAIFPKQVSALTCNDSDVLCLNSCTTVDQCVGGFHCRITEENLVKEPPPGLRLIRVLSPNTDDPCVSGQGQAILGGIEVPVGVWQYNRIGLPTSESIGIINFASVLLRVFTIICGIWFMFNMIVAGYTFITSSGDSATLGKFKESLYFSLIGLFLLAAAFMIAGLIGAIFFGDASYIIRPTLYQAGTAPTP